MGTALPRGTELDLLAPSPLRRRRTTLFHVRVRGTAQEGWAFVVRDPVSGRCPVVWPTLLGTPTAADAPEDAASWVRSGSFPTRGEALAEGIVASEITRLGALDLDGDGTQDEVLAIARDEGATHGNVVVRHTAAGYTAHFLGRDADTEMTSSEMRAPVPAGPAGYVLFSSGSLDLAAGGGHVVVRAVQVSRRPVRTGLRRRDGLRERRSVDLPRRGHRRRIAARHRRPRRLAGAALAAQAFRLVPVSPAEPRRPGDAHAATR